MFLRLHPNSKLPVDKGHTPFPLSQLKNWKGNIGLLTGTPSGTVVRDYDGPEGLELARTEYRADLFRCLVKTPNGLHVYCKQPDFEVKNSVRVNGQPVDHRGTGGYVVYPGSVINGKPYQFIKGSITDLPPFPKEWLPIETTREITRGEIRKLDHYLEKVERSSRGLVRATAICRDSGVDELDAYERLVKWNVGFTTDEIKRVIRNLFRGSR